MATDSLDLFGAFAPSTFDLGGSLGSGSLFGGSSASSFDLNAPSDVGGFPLSANDFGPLPSLNIPADGQLPAVPSSSGGGTTFEDQLGSTVKGLLTRALDVGGNIGLAALDNFGNRTISTLNPQPVETGGPPSSPIGLILLIGVAAFFLLYARK